MPEIVAQRNALDIARVAFLQTLERRIRRQHVLRFWRSVFLLVLLFFFFGLSRAHKGEPDGRGRDDQGSPRRRERIDRILAARFAHTSLHLISATASARRPPRIPL